MINFYRKIRKQLAAENNARKYIRYAIGEVLLVVIGILIALQINQWNHNRLEKVEEREILSNLNEEFIQNKKQLAECIQADRDAISANTVLIQLIGSDRSELNFSVIDSLMYYSFSAKEFIPSDNATSNIVQSGKLNLITDKNISSMLYQWSSITKLIRDREETLDKWTTDVELPYLLKHISFRAMDVNGGYSWSGPSSLKRDYYPLFQELEFENILDNALYDLQSNLDIMIEADRVLDKLIEATKKVNYDRTL